jgi:hypothetical protein
LLALVSDRIWFDGFECFRINDLRDLRPDPYALFAEAALKKRDERRPKKPRVSVANIEDLLLSAGKAFPLVTYIANRSIRASVGSAVYKAWTGGAFRYWK